MIEKNNDKNKKEDDIPMFLRAYIDGENKFKPKPLTLEDFDIIINDDDNKEIENSEELCDIDEYEKTMNPIENLDKSTNKFPISKYKAFQIANENQNLKSDFCRIFDKKITYLDFNDCKITLKTIEEDTFWHIKITDGKMSWVELDYSLDDEIPNTIFCDGTFSKKDYKLLQCLINVKTGEYKYFPKENL